MRSQASFDGLPIHVGLSRAEGCALDTARLQDSRIVGACRYSSQGFRRSCLLLVA